MCDLGAPTFGSCLVRCAELPSGHPAVSIPTALPPYLILRTWQRRRRPTWSRLWASLCFRWRRCHRTTEMPGPFRPCATTQFCECLSCLLALTGTCMRSARAPKRRHAISDDPIDISRALSGLALELASETSLYSIHLERASADRHRLPQCRTLNDRQLAEVLNSRVSPAPADENCIMLFIVCKQGILSNLQLIEHSLLT